MRVDFETHKSSYYRFTIDMNNQEDLNNLKLLKKMVSENNKFNKDYNNRFNANLPLKRVALMYRKPLLKNDINKYYSNGGNVVLSQKPQEADVYVFNK